jgi:hypothetical protein
MKHRLILTIGLAALVCSAVAATASAGPGGNRLFQFRGEVVAASATSVQITVEGGNRAALRAMLGQSQNETFTLGTTSEVLVWSHGIPKVGTFADLKTNDWVQVNVARRPALLCRTSWRPQPHRRRPRHRARQGRQASFPLPRTYAMRPKINVDVKGGNRLAPAARSQRRDADVQLRLATPSSCSSRARCRPDGAGLSPTASPFVRAPRSRRSRRSEHTGTARRARANAADKS